jgi:hypothetical protein
LPRQQKQLLSERASAGPKESSTKSRSEYILSR